MLTLPLLTSAPFFQFGDSIPSTHCVSVIGRVIALWGEELPAVLRRQQSKESAFPVGWLEPKKTKIVFQSDGQSVFAAIW